jgi:hypothetical protein
MVIVGSVACRALQKYQHAWIVAQTEHVQEAADALGVSVGEFTQRLQDELKKASINIGNVELVRAECDGVSYDCFHVQREPDGSQFAPSALEQAIAAVGLVADQMGALDARTDKALKLKQAQKRKRGNDTGEWAAVAAQLGIEDESSIAVLAAIKDLQQHAAAQSQRATILGKGYYSLMTQSADRLGACFSLTALVSGLS